MPTLSSLRRTFQRAMTAAMVASPALGACTTPGIEDDRDFVPAPCDGARNLWLTDLSPERAVDFLELMGPGGAVQETYGQACKTASLVAVCETKLAELRTMTMSMSSPALRTLTGADHYDSTVLHVTRGDEVFEVRSTAALLTLLGKIDSAEEAMFVTQTSGYNVRCNGGGARPSDDGFEVQAYLSVGCDGVDRYLIAVDSDGTVQRLDKTTLKKPQRNCAVGRMPAGLRMPARAPCVRAGEYLARASALEAASVEAFRRLAAELELHGAPARLSAAAREAARDEVRHARVTARLAQRMGREVERPRIGTVAVRALEAIATENAWEGCVRETFGALEGAFMARHAADPRVRGVYRRIAADELRHAALSWRVARWIEPRLAVAARRRVAEVRRSAVVDLQCELRSDVSAEIRRVCGVPSAREAQLLFSSLSPSLA
jgi:hypothetical protein